MKIKTRKAALKKGSLAAADPMLTKANRKKVQR
jgi:hypothetical protein